ncbi:MAG TPA: glycosyltransferase family 39 protein [Myxococcaceae bacterium]|nr:glycosyltransferase family 39 protein [Myxococcaceae bacterium]
MSRAPSPLDRRIALGLGLVTFVVLWATERPVGFVRDESVYFAAAEQFARWWALLFHAPASALSDRGISQAFDFNHEHPMLMKSLYGWSHALFHSTLGWVRPAAGFRLPAFAVAALIPALLHAWGSVLWGRRAGLFAALCFFVVPRHFFHAHLACFDMPVAAMWFLVVYLFWRAEEDLRLAPWVGLAFGLALATKHNAFFLPVVLTPFGVRAAWRTAGADGRSVLVRMAQAALAFLGYALLVLVVRGREGLVQSWQLLSPQTFGVVALVGGLVVLAVRLRTVDPAAFVPIAPLVAMGLLGPAVFYVHWPWLWYHPVDRLAWYFDFHATHVHYAWTYFGDVLRAPPFPLSYVFVVTALTLPVSLLLPMGVGLLRTAVRNLGDLVPALGRRFGRGGSAEWLLGVNALFSIVLISLPDVPHFGGVKHWLPSMPFLALLAGREFGRASVGLASALPLAPRRAIAATLALGAVVLLPALTLTVHVHPYGTSAYGELAGGIPGAASLGLQRQYWSNNVTGVLPWIDANARQGARVWLHEVNGLSFRDYQRNGMLRTDVVPVGGPEDADLAAVQYHQEFREQEVLVWQAFGTWVPSTGLYLDETPQVVVYRRP